MKNLNISTWDKVYSEGRSLLMWPDETVVSSLNKHREKLKKGIDLACGAGRHAILMAQMGIESVGVDSSKSAIEFANKRSRNMGLKNIHFINSLVQDIEFEKESFDIVIAWGLIHYLEKEEQEKLIDKVRNLLKPNGIFLLTLRSIEDSRAKMGINIGGNQFLVNYFDENTEEPKQTLMYFWDKEGVFKILENFSNINLGHRVIEPIGKLGVKSSHWIIEAQK